MIPALKKLIPIGIVAELVIFFICLYLQPDVEETFRYAARYSGRLSAVVFLFSFYRYAVDFPRSYSANLSLRRVITLFAVLHIIHWGFLATNVVLNNIPLEAHKLVGGALAYLMIVLAPFHLHKFRTPIRMVYFYYVSLVMVMTYVARLKGDFLGAEPFWFHYFMVGVFILCAVGFGFWMFRKKNKKF